MNDGTFYTKETATSAHYYYGTYEINNNEITLNYQFSMGNAQGSYGKYDKVISIPYKINEDNSITFENTTVKFEHGETYFAEGKTLIKTSDDCNIIKDFTDLIISSLMMEAKTNY